MAGLWRALVLGLVVLALAGCGGQRGSAALPTVVLDGSAEVPAAAGTGSPRNESAVVASGNIVAGSVVKVSSTAPGVVADLLVAEGDLVTAGESLARLGGADRLDAALEAARFELLSAQQARDQLDESYQVDWAAAQLRVARANQALDDARQKRAWRQYRNGSDANIQAGQADLILAKERLEKAHERYDPLSERQDNDLLRAAALSELSAAQKAYDRAVANLNYLTAMPDELEVAQAEAELVAAQAEADSAAKALAKLATGPDAEALALAEARIANAEAQVKAAQKALADLEISAPVDGTVGEVLISKGEWAQAGQVILVLLDMEHLYVETSDLSERDVPRIHLGQNATVTVEALGVDVNGKVSWISPLADTLGGDVVYKVRVALEDPPEGLLPGMSVYVYFE